MEFIRLLLDVSSGITISFDYVFSDDFSSSSKRWMKICLANANNEIIKVLETVDFIGAAAKLPKNTVLNLIISLPVNTVLILQYGGNGETARIAVDELKISAPFKYEGGCNASPVVLKSKITGRPDRTAFGSLLLDDNNTNKNKLSAYLIKGSSNGTVKLNQDGTFIFTPNKGFEGTSTNFVYKVCEEGAGNLCSANTTVNIEFPNASYKVLLILRVLINTMVMLS